MSLQYILLLFVNFNLLKQFIKTNNIVGVQKATSPIYYFKNRISIRCKLLNPVEVTKIME